MERKTLETSKLERPVQILIGVKDPDQALDAMLAHAADDPARAAQLRAVRALNDDLKEKWLLAHVRPSTTREPASGSAAAAAMVSAGGAAAGCAIVVFVVAVIVGYKIVKKWNEKMQQYEEVEEAIYGEEEQEKEVCPDD